MGIYSIV